jgi:hypothetical protein
MRWERIDILIAEIQDGIDSISFTQLNGKTLIREQTEIVRTNCIDCLDRTNVVQSVIAKQILGKQRQELGIPEIDWDAQFIIVWSDNADAISIQYPGTPGQKTDYTRPGKRRVAGRSRTGRMRLIGITSIRAWPGSGRTRTTQ